MEFGAFLEVHRITIATLPPSYLHVMPRKTYDSLRIIITAGEEPRMEDVAQYCSRVEYYNAYGPTESTVWTTVNRIHPGTVSGAGCSNIGRPIQNLSIWILDSHLKMLPVHHFGELCIGGIGLAQGYLNNAARTNEQFVPHPYQPGEILYRSADRARWLPDGTLELSGRIDEQLKIRGYRIEPGEIENHLLAHPLVREAVVIGHACDTSDRHLAACLVLKEDAGLVPSADDIRKYLQNSLPSFMIPAFVCFMDALPLTHNGKIDRKVLSERLAASSDDPPRPSGEITPLENTLLEIWGEVLPTKTIDIHDNFFDLGGNSLHAIQIASKLSQVTGSIVSARAILSNLTISKLSSAMEKQADRPLSYFRPVEDREAYEMSPAQKQIWLAHELSSKKNLYNVQACYRIIGDLDIPHLKTAIRNSALRHEALRSCFVNVNGELMFRVLDENEVVFEVQEYDHSQMDNGMIEEFIASLDEYVFDLTRAPLVRASLIRLAEDEHILILVLHHLVCDWISIKVLQEEIRRFYRAEKTGATVSPPASAAGYREHAALQNRALEHSPGLEQYWASIFSDRPQSLRLPVDYVRPLVRTHAGNLHMESFPAELVHMVAEKARQWNTTPYTVLFASLNVLFHKYAGQTDIVLGTIMAGRENAFAENVVGCFMNTLAIRTRFQSADTFASLVEKVKHLILEAHEHQSYPLHRIANMLNAQGSSWEDPLFNVMIDMLFIDTTQRLELTDGTAMFPTVYNYRKSKYDLTLYILAAPKDITILYEYSTEVFSSATIQTFARRWGGLLKKLLAEGDREIRDVELDDALQLPTIKKLRRG
jgi:hypothetical protein